MHKLIIGALVGAIFALPAHATTVFSHDFEAYPSNSLNFNGFSGFTVTGAVDVVGASNPFGISVGSNVVDLDGSPGAGMLTSQTINFSAGDLVSINYDLAGGQRGNGDNDWFSGIDFLTGINTDLSDSGIVGQDDPFATHMLSFTALADGSFNFFVGTNSTDSVGPLLDNVSVAIANGNGAVPEPASWAMMLAGFGLVGGAARYSRRKPLTTLA